MLSISRRTVLGMSAGALLATADPLGLPIGCQVYPVREALAKDFDGTLHRLSGIGYRRIEMCSPAGYVSSGFGPLVGIKPAEMKQRIQAAGLGCESCHFGFKELRENLDDRIAFSKELGLRQMVLSTFALPAGASMDDWSRAADQLNGIAERVAKAGMLLGLHNHDFEFHEIDGVLIYDSLMRRLDSQLVKMQFQVSVVSLGFQAAQFFRKYPGRFLSAHLQDWSPTENKQVPVGKGVVDWKDLFAAAKTGGIRNYFVEMDLDAMQASYPYLHELKT